MGEGGARVWVRVTRMYEITACTAGAGVVVGGGSIGDDGANETIGDVSRSTIGEREQERDGSNSGTGAIAGREQ